MRPVLGGNRAISDRGLSVGRYIAVFLAGDPLLGDFLQPALTRFRPDLHAVGRRWAGILLASSPGYTDTPACLQEIMPMTLVQRESDGLAR